MKLLTFVKNEPKRAEWAILLLAVSFLTCFSALIALGGMSVYARASEKRTTAALVAADLLTLRQAYAAGERDASLVLQTQIELRSAGCLPRAEREMLCGMLSASDGRFFALCDRIERVAEEGRMTGKSLSAVIRDAENGDFGVLSRASHTELQSDSGILYVPSMIGNNPLAIAEAYFDVHRIFHATDDGVYCDNLYARFDLGTRRMLSYAVECIPGTAQWTETACTEKAILYAKERNDIKEFVPTAVGRRGGICWVEAKSDSGMTAKIGVRMDTGAVCFFQWITEN